MRRDIYSFSNDTLDYSPIGQAKSQIKKIINGFAQTVSKLTRQLIQRRCLIIMNFPSL